VSVPRLVTGQGSVQPHVQHEPHGCASRRVCLNRVRARRSSRAPPSLMHQQCWPRRASETHTTRSISTTNYWNSQGRVIVATPLKPKYHVGLMVMRWCSGGALMGCSGWCSVCVCVWVGCSGWCSVCVCVCVCVPVGVDAPLDGIHAAHPGFKVLKQGGVPHEGQNGSHKCLCRSSRETRDSFGESSCHSEMPLQ
jgi:hypothetical protein